ncbi:bifunctional 3-oxoadipate enol-lactonase/4-carboxymuconolactone decarboxylase PcaDC [Teichococcus vastitatis]|uniref:4-carboxymuconolactone decarboxylase n=1 Tax=Teichococcus vastitatis TaxID=2307076 RepID=A0ABS9W0R7_9PROT|nr:4-carboxymuconolactone decarboxylase [Pseudoroseomonas vastitatis]MCI0752771.1 4-carboxymuconolactone decarboxylase [Pseudoroseomonas vastitatis]
MFVQIGDHLVHCVVEGPDSAPPVLLLHSIGTTQHVWEPQAAALSRRWRVIRPDMRGHGLTGVTPGEYSMRVLAQDVVALMDALEIPRAHVAGLSIGGRIAQQLAVDAPERVASLMLVDTAMEFPDPATWQNRIEAVLRDGTGVLADTVMPRWVMDPATPSARGLRHMLLRTDPVGYAAAAAALRDARAEEVRGRMDAPCTVIVGEHDPASPVAAAEALREAIPGAGLVVLPGVNHIPNFEAAGALCAAMLAHLEAQPRPAEDFLEAGFAVRRAVLGEAHVARATAAVTALDQPFQDYITRNVWGQIWTRPGLPRHTRSLLTLAMMAALGRHEEFVLHVRATKQTGVTPEELAEVLLQVAAYAGVPVANHALKLAKQTFHEMEEPA